MPERTYGIRELANWILDYADENRQPLTNMSLNKLVYFAYAHALVNYNRKLSSAKIEAWEHGPVFREIYHSFKNFGSGNITNRASKYNAATNVVEIVEPVLSERDQAIIKEALGNLIRLPAAVLREISHASGGAWDRTWHHEGYSNPGMQITDHVILAAADRKGLLQ